MHLKVLNILKSPFQIHANVLINLLVVICNVDVQLIHFVVAEVLVVVIFPCLFKPFLRVDASCFVGFVAAITPVKRKEFKDGLFLFVCFSLLIFKLVVSFHCR